MGEAVRPREQELLAPVDADGAGEARLARHLIDLVDERRHARTVVRRPGGFLDRRLGVVRAGICLVPEHDLPVLYLEDGSRGAARGVAGVSRPFGQLELDDHLVVSAQLEAGDPATTGKTCVPPHGIRVSLESRRAVLDDQRAVGEEPRRRLVVVPVQRRAPITRHLLGGDGLVAPAAGQCKHAEDDCRPPHAGSLPAVDFELTAEQREIQALAREFAAAEIEPNAAEWDRAHAFPPALLTNLGEVGLMGVCVPEEYGGAGADFLSYILVLEELSRADAGVGVTVAVHTSACSMPILQFGTEEQRARFVPPLARGEGVGCFALTEPGSGSDAGSIVTSATEADGGWQIRGAKQWITNAAFGGTILFFARTGTESRTARGISAFVVDTDQVTITRTEEKLGLNSSVTNDIAIDSHIEADRLIGDLHH